LYFVFIKLFLLTCCCSRKASPFCFWICSDRHSSLNKHSSPCDESHRPKSSYLNGLKPLNNSGYGGRHQLWPNNLVFWLLGRCKERRPVFPFCHFWRHPWVRRSQDHRENKSPFCDQCCQKTNFLYVCDLVKRRENECFLPVLSLFWTF